MNEHAPRRRKPAYSRATANNGANGHSGPLPAGAAGAARERSPIEAAFAQLRTSGLSITRRRKEILQILADSPRPLTAREIGERLPDSKECDPGTVCRCLRVFDQAGLVSRLGFGRNKAAVYELRAGPTPQGCLVTRNAVRGGELVGGPAFNHLNHVIAKVYADLERRGYHDITHVVQFFARARSTDEA